MKAILTLLLIIFSLYSYSQYCIPKIYQSNYSEEYIYDTIQNDYVILETLCDSIKIEIDTISNTFMFIQQVDSNICLIREFSINNFEFQREEQMYYFFVEEMQLPKQFSRKHIIYFSLSDSLITIVLENQYSICYFLVSETP